jgi:hypothetical protein
MGKQRGDKVKSENRIKGYKKGSESWNEEYNMLLYDGITCNECIHCKRCRSVFGINLSNCKCDFYPNRFQHKGGER